MIEELKAKYRKCLKRRPATAAAQPVEPEHRKFLPMIEHSVLGCCGLSGIAQLSEMTKFQLDLLERISIKEGKGAMMCVIVEQAIDGNRGWHGSQQHVVPLLEGNGWQRLQTFFNPNSGNTLGLWCKILPRQEARIGPGWAEAPSLD